MAVKDYYDILMRGLPAKLRVERLVHGISWTAAVLSDGRTGVAMHTFGETVPRMFDSLLGLPLPTAAEALMSWNMEEASEALAAVNAWYNTEDCGYVLPWSKTLDGFSLKGRTVGMIGKMLGHSNMTAEDFLCTKAFYVMDREEKPGALPDSACEYYLPSCDLVIITGSAAINKTMPRLLELSRLAEVILVGPSVSCCPGLLQLGIDRLNGRVITQPEAMLRAIVEKRGSVNPFSVNFQLDAAGVVCSF
ncbi:MAG: hypothetical protein IK149_05020 [Oscillospiraceae bacterium]|nr:hypothetical protein [Oscillospiraceae bacterium]